MKKIKNYVVKEGEVTNHAHVIVDEIELDEKERKFINKDNVSMKHEEHDTIVIPKTNPKVNPFNKIGDVQEYNHFEEETRNVLD